MTVRLFFRVGAFIGIAALTACAGGAQQSSIAPSSSTAAAQTSQTASGLPQKTDSGNVPTAPINIPPIFNKQGLDIDGVRAAVVAEIRDACGDGELCVNVAVSQGDNDSFTQCQYDASTPQSFSDQEQFTLTRGSTLTLLTGTQPCESTTEETTDESTAESTPTSTPPSSTSPAEPSH